MDSKIISILVDNESWIIPYAQQLERELCELGYLAQLVDTADKVQSGWVTFMLGCTRLVSDNVLRRNKHNLVVHESSLPEGRGFAPMAWQILDGKNKITVCLLEAETVADAGDIWLSDFIPLSGKELCDEWRALQGEKTIELCRRFVLEYEQLIPRRQEGEASWYPRRRPEDSVLDIKKTLEEQFNLLRIVDNSKYPAYFEIDGDTYTISITRGKRQG